MWQETALLPQGVQDGIRAAFREALLALLHKALQHVIVVDVGATILAAAAQADQSSQAFKGATILDQDKAIATKPATDGDVQMAAGLSAQMEL